LLFWCFLFFNVFIGFFCFLGCQKGLCKDYMKCRITKETMKITNTENNKTSTFLFSFSSLLMLLCLLAALHITPLMCSMRLMHLITHLFCIHLNKQRCINLLVVPIFTSCFLPLKIFNSLFGTGQLFSLNVK